MSLAAVCRMTKSTPDDEECTVQVTGDAATLSEHHAVVRIA